MQVEDRLYEVTKISFFYMTIEATEIDLTINDLPEDEVWDLEEFKRYKVKLINNGGMGEIVDFSAWVNSCK